MDFCMITHFQYLHVQDVHFQEYLEKLDIEHAVLCIPFPAVNNCLDDEMMEQSEEVCILLKEVLMDLCMILRAQYVHVQDVHFYEHLEDLDTEHAVLCIPFLVVMSQPSNLQATIL